MESVGDKAKAVLSTRSYDTHYSKKFYVIVNKSPIMIDSEKIEKVFDIVDGAFVDALNEHEPTFEEIHIILWRINRKIEEQELQLYYKYFNEEGTDSVNDISLSDKKLKDKSKDHMYG